MNERSAGRGVVAPFWVDRPGEEALGLAAAAERLGYGEFWVGEMLHLDAFALAGAIAQSTNQITFTVGPLALGLRDPVSLAMGVGSVETIGRRQARLAIGVPSSENPTRPLSKAASHSAESRRPLCTSSRCASAGAGGRSGRSHRP